MAVDATLRQTTPCEQNDRQVQKYYLGHNFVAAGNNQYFFQFQRKTWLTILRAMLVLCRITITVLSARKNVLLVIADEMRVEAEPYKNHWGFSVAPNELHIPNLEDLAKTQQHFTEQVSVCGPS